MKIARSKRDIVPVRINLRRLFSFCLSVSTAEESNLLSHDLGDVLFLSLFIIEGPVAERSFDVDLPALLQMTTE